MAVKFKVLSWQDVETIVDVLAEKIRASGFKPDLVIGITMGGLVPLALVAKKLGINNVRTISAFSYDKDEQQSELKIISMPEMDIRGQNVLLIDEIADTGRTLKEITKIARVKYGVELKTATLAVNMDRSAIVPDFYAVEGTGEFILFPWERDEFPEHFQ